MELKANKNQRFEVVTSLAEQIDAKRARRAVEQNRRVKVAEIEQELADFCGVSINTIKQIKKGYNLPSLPVAFRCSQFFYTTVESLFQVVERL